MRMVFFLIATVTPYASAQEAERRNAENELHARPAIHRTGSTRRAEEFRGQITDHYLGTNHETLRTFLHLGCGVRPFSPAAEYSKLVADVVKTFDKRYCVESKRKR